MTKRTHYAIQGETTLCGRNKEKVEYVTGLEKLWLVDCVVCLNVIEANAPEAIQRTSYTSAELTEFGLGYMQGRGAA